MHHKFDYMYLYNIQCSYAHSSLPFYSVVILAQEMDSYKNMTRRTCVVSFGAKTF